MINRPLVRLFFVLSALWIGAAHAEPGVTADTIKIGAFGPITGRPPISDLPDGMGQTSRSRRSMPPAASMAANSNFYSKTMVIRLQKRWRP